MEKILKLIDSRLSSSSRYIIACLSILLVALLGVIDYLTGSELSFSVFYVLPVMIATWYSGRSLGYGIALFSTAAWLLAGILAGEHYSHTLIPAWNSMTRLLFFIIITELLAKVRLDLDKEAKLADTDSLTGLPNGRSFFEHMENESARARRYGHPMTIIYFDLDNFKTVNDTMGHDAGDDVLRVIASTIRDKVRRLDIVGRLGGDEFAGLFPETDYDAAHTLIHHIHPLLNKAMKDRGWPVTVSIGAAVFEHVMDHSRDMIKLADELMYGVKRSGKNSISIKRWPEREDAPDCTKPRP